MKLTPIGSFLKRSKIPIDIEDDKEYKRVTIKIKHNGVSLRDTEIGKKIGTKKQFILKAGQFIVSKIDARYGAFGIAPRSVDGAIITGNFWAYDVDFSQLNIEWFNQYTNSPAFYDLCERASAGITHRKYLNETFFLNYVIQLPSIEEQLIQIDEIKKQKISFGKLTIELTNQLSLVKQLRQAFLSEAMQGKLVTAHSPSERAGGEAETGQQLLARIKAEKAQLIKDKKLKKEKELPPIKPEEIPFEIPKDWVWCRLGEVSDKLHYGFNASGNPNITNYRLLRITDIQNNKVEWQNVPGCVCSTSEVESYLLANNDILIARTGGTIGKTYLVKDISVKSLFASYLIRVVPNKLVSPDYLKFFMESPSYWKQLNASAWGAGQPNVNGTSLIKLILPLPPLSIQNQIVAMLDGLMKTCDDLENSIKQSQLQNEQLLQQVLKEALEVRVEENI